MLFFTTGAGLKAQEVGYEEGRNYLDIGIGAPRFSLVNNYLYNAYGYNSYSMPVLRVNIEHGFNNIISAGGFAGYSHYGWSWTNSMGSWDEKHSFITFGARGTFHIWDFLNENLELELGQEELDLYASLMLGANIQRVSDKTPSKRVTNTSTGVVLGTTVGGRYYFTSRFAGYLEAGYGSSAYGIIGLTFKL